MRLNKSSVYAALALVCLARQGDRSVVQARRVAAFLGIPTDSALKVLQVLARHRLVDSQLGRAGGYRLPREAERISLLQVVEAIDGPVSPSVPMDPQSNEAGELDAPLGALTQVCDRAAELLRHELSQVSIADLARGDRKALLRKAG